MIFIKQKSNINRHLFLLIISILLLILSVFGFFQKIPLFDIFNVPISSSIVSWKDGIKTLGSKFEQNEKIVQQNLDLQKQILQKDIELSKLKTLESENASLKNLNKVVSKQNQYLLSNTITKNFADKLPQNITIDKGLSQGVKENDIVINDTGSLVGRINKVSSYTSTILPYYNESFKLQLQSDSTKTVYVSGIIDGFVIAQEVNNISSVKLNDIFFTIALDNTFPAGVFVGKVVKFQSEDKRTFLLEVDLQNIDTLYVAL